MTTSVTLRNGSKIPQLGFGTLGIPTDCADTTENAEQTAEAVGLASEARHRILRWHLQHGRIVLPKATGRLHQEQNFDVFSFNLSADYLVAIDALDQGPDGRPDEFDWVPDADNLSPTR